MLIVNPRNDLKEKCMADPVSCEREQGMQDNY